MEGDDAMQSQLVRRSLTITKDRKLDVLEHVLGGDIVQKLNKRANRFSILTSWASARCGELATQINKVLSKVASLFHLQIVRERAAL